MAYKRNNRGSIILEDNYGNNFTITKKEQQEFNMYLKRANQRRTDVAHRYYDQLNESEIMIGKSYDSYMKLLQDKGFITEKYKGGFNQFDSKNDFKSMLKELKEVTKRGYGSNRIDDIRYKMLERIEENFGSQGEELYKRIAEMDKAELLSIYTLSADEIVKTVYGCDRAKDTNELVEKSLSEINVLLKDSKAIHTENKTQFNKGFRNYKARQRTKKAKRQKGKR